MSLLKHVNDNVYMGSRYCPKSLGIQQMPDGYALILNPDRTHFYWLRHDGAESGIFCNKWMVYRSAKSIYKAQPAKESKL